VTSPRLVTITLPRIRSMTILEIARASATAGVKRTDTERLLRSLTRADADPHDLELGATLLYAWAWQLVKRDEPDATWAEAQTWRVEFDLDATDPIAEAEAEAVVSASVATGLPPDVAGALTLEHMAVYDALAEARR
jgi:hypothetical protein